MTDFRDLPTVPRLAAVATVVYGLTMLLFFGLVLWIAATTGDPVILDPHRFGEAELEAGVFAVVMGVACYGMATLDWLLRRPAREERGEDTDSGSQGGEPRPGRDAPGRRAGR